MPYLSNSSFSKMELSSASFVQLMKRFPDFELSYETISHKKVSSAYDLALAIPFGKKAFIWITFHKNKDVFYLLDINRDKKIIKATEYPYPNEDRLPLGTILYGTLLEKREGMLPFLGERFLVEDVYYVEGISLKKSSLNDKLAFSTKIMACLQKLPLSSPIHFFLPSMWKMIPSETGELPTIVPANITCYMAYPAHHIQYRASIQTMPFLNIALSTRGFLGSQKPQPIHVNTANLPITVKTPITKPGFEPGIPCTPDSSKPQYRYSAVFYVVADLQFDVYHLFAYGCQKTPVYYNLAYVPTYRSSVFLNGLFRNIRENQNLDYIEESDDEADFENMDEYKYVDIQKVLLMECQYSPKFRKWVPTRVVPKGTKVVHIQQLIR